MLAGNLAQVQRVLGCDHGSYIPKNRRQANHLQVRGVERHQDGHCVICNEGSAFLTSGQKAGLRRVSQKRLEPKASDSGMWQGMRIAPLHHLQGKALRRGEMDSFPTVKSSGNFPRAVVGLITSSCREWKAIGMAAASSERNGSASSA
jgi:hypothetical protein